jgi:hypothetical protein
MKKKRKIDGTEEKSRVGERCGEQKDEEVEDNKE